MSGQGGGTRPRVEPGAGGAVAGGALPPLTARRIPPYTPPVRGGFAIRARFLLPSADFGRVQGKGSATVKAGLHLWRASLRGRTRTKTESSGAASPLRKHRRQNGDMRMNLIAQIEAEQIAALRFMRDPFMLTVCP